MKQLGGACMPFVLFVMLLVASACAVPAGPASNLNGASTPVGPPNVAQVLPSKAQRTFGNALLRQEGMELFNGSGEAVTLRGINLGGWLMWEGWLLGGLGTPQYNSETYVYSRLTDAVGPARAEQFRRSFYDSFITEADIARIAQLGFNMVRVPFNHSLIEREDQPGTLDEAGMVYLDRVMSWASAHEVYVILDMHAAPGGQSGFYIADPEPMSLWSSLANQDRTISLWKAIAERYAGLEWLAGYDVLNEPVAERTESITDLYNRIIAAIRSVDPHHIVFLEGAWGGHALMDLGDDIVDTPNLVYSFHAYDFFGRDLAQDYVNHLAYARWQNRPLYVGEYGHVSGNALAWSTQLFQSTPEIVGWSSWTWKRPNVDYEPVIQKISLPGEWREVMVAITSGSPIDGVDVRLAMDSFIQSVRLENNVEHPEVAGLLR